MSEYRGEHDKSVSIAMLLTIVNVDKIVCS